MIPLAALAILLSACTAQPAEPSAAAGAPTAPGSILAGSVPAAGSTARAPVRTLELDFAPPARLEEITVEGPEGLMPMMVHPAGEVAQYSIPLPGLGPGSYQVRWRASAAGESHQGAFAFTVR